MIFLIFLFAVFTQTDAGCEEMFVPPRSDRVGTGAKATYDAAVYGTEGGVTAISNTMNSMADNKILDKNAKKAISAATKSLKIASTFAGPLAGIGIGFLTDAIFGDPTEQALENLEKNQNCIAQEITRMRKDIDDNSRNILINSHNIAQNKEDIDALDQAFRNLKSDMTSIIDLQHANYIDEQDQKLEYLIRDLLLCIETSSDEEASSLESELAMLLEQMENKFNPRRNLAVKIHWVINPDKCDYQGAGLWRDLKESMNQMKYMFKYLGKLVGHSCYMRKGDSLLAIVGVVAKLETAITLFLLNVKIKGLLTIEYLKDMYFDDIISTLNAAINAFNSVRNKIQALNKIGGCSMVKSSKNYWPSGSNQKYTTSHHQNTKSYEDCKMICLLNANCYGLAYEPLADMYIGGGMTPPAGEDRKVCINMNGAAMIWSGQFSSWYKPTVADKHCWAGEDEGCKPVAMALGAFKGISTTFEATKRLVTGVKTEYDTYFSQGTIAIKEFEAGAATRPHRYLKKCPAPSCGQQYTDVKSRVGGAVTHDTDQNPHPENLIGCKKGYVKYCSRRRRDYDRFRFGRWGMSD